MQSFQQLRVYQLAETISNEIWFIVKKWEDFAKDTMGKQIVRSADSVGANIAEGHGRYSSIRLLLSSIPLAPPLKRGGQELTLASPVLRGMLQGIWEE